MYLIRTVFRSNEKGIFTYTEETASDEFYKNLKYKRILTQWLKILCPYIDLDSSPNNFEERKEFLYNLIQEELKYLNSKNKDADELREFKIEVEEF